MSDSNKSTGKGKDKPSWTSLNPRQQKYLELIYIVDQENEKAEKSGVSRGDFPRPAREWRPIPYGTTYGHLTMYLGGYKLIDEGTGSTFNALEARGLIICTYKMIEGIRILHVEITPAGRKLVREATGQQRPKKLPTGTLTDYKWQALADAYQAGAAGLESDHAGHYGRHKWQTVWLPLRDFKQDGKEVYLIEEIRTGVRDYRLRLSEAGHAFYCEQWNYYRQLYPSIEAPTPVVRESFSENTD